MWFKKETKNGITIMRITQERLDSSISADLKTELLILVDQEIKDVLVDLTHVLYVDSSGLGSLLFGLRQLRELKGTLKIFSAGNRVKSLIRIAKLDQVLINFENEKEALESFN